jgi:nitrite reductase/ring-hydroxylating ferredoxin subunit
MNTLGLGSAIAAAVPGLIDYVFAVPPHSSAKKRATNHMAANLSAVALFALARAGHETHQDAASPDRPPAAWATVAELVATALMGVGGWLGGTLVYRNQIGVDHRYANAGRWHTEPLVPHSRRVDAASADELEIDQMKLLRVGAHRIVLARTDDRYVAFDDRCTHKGGPLADGALVCGTVQCPWHGSQFDVTSGTVRQGPATEGIQVYGVEVRGGRVWLEVPEDELTTA